MEQALASIYQEQGFGEPEEGEAEEEDFNPLATLVENEQEEEYQGETDLIDFLGQLDAQEEEWQHNQQEQEPSFIRTNHTNNSGKPYFYFSDLRQYSLLCLPFPRCIIRSATPEY